jgi:hypothetical protein
MATVVVGGKAHDYKGAGSHQRVRLGLLVLDERRRAGLPPASARDQEAIARLCARALRVGGMVNAEELTLEPEKQGKGLSPISF